MKIRRKDDHSVIRDLGACCHQEKNGDFWGWDGDHHNVYPSAHWELLHDKQWVDVTVECEVEAGGRIVVHRGSCRFRVEVNGTEYRVRKVRLYDKKLDYRFKEMPASFYVEVDAFIIEKES